MATDFLNADALGRNQATVLREFNTYPNLNHLVKATGLECDILMIDIDSEAHVTLFDYVGLKGYIASLFDGPVDVIDREALKPDLRRPTARDMVYAF